MLRGTRIISGTEMVMYRDIETTFRSLLHLGKL